MEEEKKKKEVNNEDSSIRKLEKGLYSRNGLEILGEERHGFKKSEHEVKEKWEQKNTQTPEKTPKRSFRLSNSFFKKILISSIVFFLIASAVSIFIIFGGLNLISSQNIDISVNGPTVVEGGEELVLDVSVNNHNRVALENISIIVEYPEGARNHLNINNPLIRQQEEIDFIPARGQASGTFRSVLFGEQNSTKEIRITVEYRTEGSNATFSKEEIYQIGIRSSPVSIFVLAPKEVSAGQEVEFKVSISSNSNTLIQDLILSIDYPRGFIFEDADPSPDFEGRTWRLGDLNPREEREIVLRGRLEGTENEEKTFILSVGLPRLDNNQEVGVEFAGSLESIIIQKPFINLVAFLEGSTEGDYISKINRRIRSEVRWRNDLPTDLNDASLEVRINGRPLNKLSVSASQNGFYNSIDDTIYWNKNDHGVLEKIISGQSGSVTFSFSTVNPEPSLISQLGNGTVDIEVIMKGTRFAESRPPETVSSSITRRVKIETDLLLNSEILYSQGPFSNTGPLPPKAEQPTTYTVFWKVTNNFNDTENVLVTATLPPYMEWLGNTSPANEEITFNSSTRTVSWNLGNVRAGTGFFLPERQVAFQISFLPSLGQVGSIPILINQSSVVGTDTFTLTNVTNQYQALNTRINNDPAFSLGSERVVQ